MATPNDPSNPLGRPLTSAERLRRIYRVRAGQEARGRTRRTGLRRPLVIGSGVLLAAVGLTLVALLATIQSALAAYDALTTNLPSLDNIYNHPTFKTAQIFDRTGKLLWEFYDPDGGKRTVVPLNQVSQHLLDATLAAEDAYFYQHHGVDLRATLRSAFITGSGESRTGASTITQQLVRAVVLSPQEAQQVTISRKLREIILAYELDSKLSKDQILEMYLNQVYYGNQSYGVEAAAEDYFNEPARDLDIAQSALIAGLVQSPSAYDPTRTDVPRTADGIPVVTKERQAYVLEQMARHGFITEAEARAAYAEPLHIQTRQVPLKAPAWVMYIRDQVEQKYGPKELYQGGLKIYTTLDLNYDEAMQKVLQDNAATVHLNHANNAALMAVDPKTGEILAFNGSMDFNDPSIDGQVNVLLSQRQPGSTIKPVVYGTAFTKGEAPGTFVDDTRTCWEDAPGHQWCPVNFDNTFHGRMTLRSALGNSMNIPAIKTLQFAGIDAVRQMGQRMGITTWGPDSGKTFGLSLTLGGAEVLPYDLTQVYADFANNGLKIPLVSITRIVDSNGKILEDYKVPQGQQVIDPRAAYMITDVLADPAAKLITYGPNTPLVFKDRENASKTGTTDQARDTWTAGYVPDLAMVVWVGNTDGHPMGNSLSTMTAGKIWPEAMQQSLKLLNIPPTDFVRPPGLVQAPVCGDTTMRPGYPSCRMDLYLSESAPPGAQPLPPGPVPRDQMFPESYGNRTSAAAAASRSAGTAAPRSAPPVRRPAAAQPPPAAQPTQPPAPAPTTAPAAAPTTAPAPAPTAQPAKPTAAPAAPKPTPAPARH